MSKDFASEEFKDLNPDERKELRYIIFLASAIFGFVFAFLSSKYGYELVELTYVSAFVAYFIGIFVLIMIYMTGRSVRGKWKLTVEKRIIELEEKIK